MSCLLAYLLGSLLAFIIGAAVGALGRGVWARVEMRRRFTYRLLCALDKEVPKTARELFSAGFTPPGDPPPWFFERMSALESRGAVRQVEGEQAEPAWVSLL